MASLIKPQYPELAMQKRNNFRPTFEATAELVKQHKSSPASFHDEVQLWGWGTSVRVRFAHCCRYKLSQCRLRCASELSSSHQGSTTNSNVCAAPSSAYKANSKPDLPIENKNNCGGSDGRFRRFEPATDEQATILRMSAVITRGSRPATLQGPFRCRERMSRQQGANPSLAPIDAPHHESAVRCYAQRGWMGAQKSC